MRCIATAALSVAVLITGCQHIPPQPLDLREALQERPLDVETVQQFAARFAQQGQQDSFDISNGVTLLEAQAIALYYNAGLRVARLEAQQVEAVAAAGMRPEDPQLGLEHGRKKVEGLDGVERHWIDAASLSITLPISGRLAAQRSLAGAHAHAVALAAAEAEWRTLHELRLAWAHWSAEVERARLLQEKTQAMEQYHRMADSLAEVGELLPASARLFAIELSRAQARLHQARAQAESHRLRLLHLMGLLPDAPIHLLPSLDRETASPAGADAATHPTVLRAVAEYEAAEAALRVELRKQYPDITISPTYTDEQDETSIVLGLGMPVPVWNANRAGIAEAAAARDTARARAMAAYQQVLSEVARATADAAGAAAVVEAFTTGAAPQVDLQLRETQALLERGEVDMVVVFEALRQAMETKEEMLEALLAQQIAQANLLAATAIPQGETHE